MTLATVTTRAQAKGTPYAPGPGEPFRWSEGRAEYNPLTDFLPKGRANARKENRRALRRIALEVLSEAVLDDPTVNYAREVPAGILDKLRGRIGEAEEEILSDAFEQGVRHAARAVAAAWLRDRGDSLPIPREDD